MEKVFKVADIRDLEQKVALGEMSYSRMVEVLNEKTEEYYSKVKKLNEPEAQIETPNINNNEGKRECCSHPEKYRFVDKEGYLRCSNCHGYIE